MSKDLYFIPIIADALKQPDSRVSLRAAIEKIQNLGRQPQYERGLQQFQQLMAQVKLNWEKSSQKPEDMALDVIRHLALQVTSGLLEGDEVKAILDLIRSHPLWQEEFERLSRDASESEIPRLPEIIIEKNGERIASIPCGNFPVTHKIQNVTPGLYTISLDTGRILWQEDLTEQELIWTIAFPEQALDLAADTGEGIERSTREIRLLDGSLIVRVFPELESGRLELKIRESRLV
jgi:hypothetical protein